ncbi:MULTISPECIES: aconitase X [Cupriavidus]
MLELSSRDLAMRDGQHGEAAALAMRILTRAAQVMGASRLIDIEGAHIDGCLYHGMASLDFVERLVAGGGKVVVPTTLNVGSLDLIHPELFRGEEGIRSNARRLMDAHLELGCASSFTCAPYQLARRPRLGQQIAWAESNAIVFANSVLGARTNRYGDFIDLCAALTGRAPYAGLHLPENRFGQVVFHVAGLEDRRTDRDILFAALGFLIGKQAGTLIPVITGLPGDSTEDELKALGAAAASSGAVALFHAVGVTPEAPTLAAALGGRPPVREVDVPRADLVKIRASLNKARKGDALAAVSVGTPHFSLAEFAALERLLAGLARPLAVDFYVNTSRFILWELEQTDAAARLAASGVQIVTDTCTYITPVMKQTRGLVMTNSGKWAHYAPANIGVEVAYGSLFECVRSAALGEVWFDDGQP